MKYLIFSAALLMGMVPQSIHAQFGGRATHGSQGGVRHIQISMPQLRMLIREVVREAVRDSNHARPNNSARTTEKTIDQITSMVERRLALRAPFRIIRKAPRVAGCEAARVGAVIAPELSSANHGTRGFIKSNAKAPSGSWLKIFANKPNAQARPLCYTVPPCRQPFITVQVAVG